MAVDKPTVFVSYSWEGKRHQNWVNKLAQALALNGVFVHVDFWETGPGMDISQYMESNVRDSNHVLIICTPKYAARANDRKGGVGVETSLVTGETFTVTGDNKKFVPILRQGEPAKALPTYLRTRVYIDFRGRAFKAPLLSLLRHIFDERELKRPDIGPKPTFPSVVLPKKATSKAKRAGPPKKRVVRKKQRELQRLMSVGLGRRPSDRETRRDAISRAATGLGDVPPPSGGRIGGRSTPKKSAKRPAPKK